MKYTYSKSLTLIVFAFICSIAMNIAPVFAETPSDNALATTIIDSMTQVDNALQQYVVNKGAQPVGSMGRDFYPALIAAGVLPAKIDNVEIIYGDEWMVWGSKPGTYIMWTSPFSAGVCNAINKIASGDETIYVGGGKPDPAKKGLQCFDNGSHRYYAIKPVYIND